MDLLLGWTGDGGSRGLAAALRGAIRDGRLVPDTALPSTRVLAAELGVARGTVTRAYGDLAAEGYLHTAQGAPTTVARLAPPPRGAVPPRPRPWLGDAARWDLMPGRPDLSSFPRVPWGAAVRSVLTHAESAAFGYGDVGGAWPLREALAAYLGRTRGVVADPDRVLVCGGYSHAVAATAAVLRDRGARRVAFEDPSLFVFRDVVAAHGLEIRPVPVDADGIRVAEIGAPSAVVVTPAHQFPTGVVLAPRRRAELVGWAARSGGLVIEDDYDGEFRFDRQQVGAVQAMAPEHVVYTGTVSKTLGPALRIGWLVPPRALVDRFREAMSRFGWRPPVLEQLALAAMLDGGDYDRHVRRRRRAYRERHRRLIGALAAFPPGAVTTSGIAAGLQTLVLTPGVPEARLRAAARRHEVSMGYLSSFRMGATATGADGVVVGYAAPADHAFTPALHALTATLRDATGSAALRDATPSYLQRSRRTVCR